MVKEYEEEIMEPELRPEFVAKVRKAEKGRFIKVKNVDEYFENLRKR